MKNSNSAMANAMSKADAALLEDLHKLDAASHSEGRAVLSARLKTLARDLANHFRLEEQNGYMDVVRKRQPRLEREVQHLEDEHRELTRTLDELVHETSSAAAPERPFQEKVRAWIEHMRRHERRENSLVEEAFNLDIAAED